MRKFKFMVLISAFAFMGCNRQNSLEVSCAAPLEKKDFKIDLQVLASGDSVSNVFDGISQKEINSGYGENDWSLSYNDSLYANFRHIITNRNDKHKYKFYFYIKNNLIHADVDIQGVSALHKTVTFTIKRKTTPLVRAE